MPESLKGVLVVDIEGRLDAQELNIPLDRESSSAISMADNEKQMHLTDEPSLSKDPNPASSEEFDGGIGMALLFAFIGGAILNLMPCVLPVVSFKIMSFYEMAGQAAASS